MKFVLLKRKVLSLFLCLLCAAAMFYVVNHPAVIGAAATTRQLPIYCVQRDQKVVSLSFDAAWGDLRVRHSCFSHAATAQSPEWTVAIRNVSMSCIKADISNLSRPAVGGIL